MAIFATQYTKLGNIWPLDYLAIMPTGETSLFRLKRREGKKSNAGAELQFVSIDETDTNIYRTRLDIEPIKVNYNGKIYDSVNEYCTIDYNGIPLLLDSSVRELGGIWLTWEERRNIIRKLKEYRHTAGYQHQVGNQ